MERIHLIEQKNFQKLKEIEYIRSQTKQCHIPNLADPRSCFIDSNYECTWNELAERCDQKR